MQNLFTEKYRAAIENAGNQIGRSTALNQFIISARNHGINGNRFDYEKQFPGINFAQVRSELDALDMDNIWLMAHEFHCLSSH